MRRFILILSIFSLTNPLYSDWGDNAQFGSKNQAVCLFLEEAQVIIISFPKCGSLSLIKWGMLVSGLADHYAIDMTKHAQNLSETFTADFGWKGPWVQWHSLFHHKNCKINLHNHDFTASLLDPNNEKYLVIRDPYERLITAYVNHYNGFKQIHFAADYSFKDMVNSLYEKKFINHHVMPFASLLDDEIKQNLHSFKIIKLESLADEISAICKNHKLAISLENIPNDHKNNLFGDVEYEQIYNLPLPLLKKGRPAKKKELWFDDEMRAKMEEIFQEDFQLFSYHLKPLQTVKTP